MYLLLFIHSFFRSPLDETISVESWKEFLLSLVFFFFFIFLPSHHHRPTLWRHGGEEEEEEEGGSSWGEVS